MSAQNEKLVPAAVPPEAVPVLERLGEGARDALTDEMVGRLAETLSGGMTLLDQLNRSGLEQALPVLAQMVQSGDLERLANLARLLGSAQDALTDEMIGRLAETLSGGMTLLDQINRNGAERLVRILTRLETVESMLVGLQEAAKAVEEEPETRGMKGLWRLIKNRENQRALRFFVAVGKELQKRCRAGC